MKLFKNILNSVKPHFVEGGKLEKLYPAYDAFETFLFVPDHTSHSGGHIRDAIDLKRTMFSVILALLPALIFGMWNIGYQHFIAIGITEPAMMEAFIYGAIKVLPMIVVSYGVGLGIEFGFAISRGHSVNEGYLVTGLLIPMIMPADLPLWMLAISVAFAVVIGKEVFGGTGMNIMNPALTARAFLYFAYPTVMSGDKVWVSLNDQIPVDGYSGATALSNAYNGLVDQVPSLLESFIGTIPGSASETSALLILVGAVYLIATGIGSWRVILSGILGGIVMGLIFNYFSGSIESTNYLLKMNPIHQICLGGFLFGVVFMATDPVSAAQTNTGKWIYGFLVGLLGILIRVVNPAYPEGIMMAILFMNIMAPLIDHYVVSANINRRMKRVKTA
ncbi:MAG: NADH:ubiquinone reductase (Na(+)-transporting) subunit B [Flavobacteriales bacterium]|jgi:Na+-transporting NADH:ubiquinone oxidoreductase subunit B|tara:strand:+ start:1266 stop:2435 length:1170 start_codon:yes stop_codon:yes gene_type:complete